MQILVSPQILTHYDPALPLRLAGDASAYGIGAVISHVLPDGSEKPIAFASRSLSSSEHNYAQLEKEALSLVYGVKKFHQNLYGGKFELFTDHKLLTAIFGSKKGVPSLAATQLQRWAIILSAYQYDIQFKPRNAHAHADRLSRLPLSVAPEHSISAILYLIFPKLTLSQSLQPKSRLPQEMTVSSIKYCEWLASQY